MPNTSNFNWPTPADTDLVKDGAAAIRNLGNGVDTSLVDLKGGTTGQILSKASNADMDFAFVTPNVGDLTEVQAGVGISVASGTGPIPIITNSSTDLITTAGDLLYGTAADTVARLGIGTASQVLAVNSGATAPEWVTPAAGGGFTLLATATLSSTGTFTFSSISGSHKHLFINVIDLIGSANDAEYKMQFNQTGSHSSRSIYYNGSAFDLPSQRNETSFGNGGVSECPIQRMYTVAGDFGDITAKSQIWIYDYASTTLQKNVSWIAGGNARFAIGSAIWEETAAITRIDFIPFAATTATGTVQLYGVS
jgi:hypothetical protein